MVSRGERAGGGSLREIPGERSDVFGFSKSVAFGVLASALIAGLVGYGSLKGASAPAEQGTADPGERAVPREVSQVLRTIHGLWVPRERNRAVDRLSQERLRYEPSLREVLRDPQDPLFWSGVVLAVGQRNVRLVPSLITALHSADDATKERLVAEIDRIEPWDEQELAQMLQGDSAGLLLGALRVVAGRSARPVDAIVPLLVDSNASVRAAALAALPETLGSDVGRRILMFCDFAPSERIGEALAALGRCPLSRPIEDVLYRELDPRTRHAPRVLQALQARAVPLSRPGPVFDMVQNPFAPVVMRGRALQCLELTRTPGAADMLETLRFEHAALEYLAARVLLLAQRPSGVSRLIAVLDESYDARNGDDTVLVQEARMGAREILGMLAGTSIYEDVVVWEAWAADLQGVVTRRLPPVAVTFSRIEGS